MLLACDPGLRGVGIAWFDDRGILRYANYIRNPVTEGDGPTAWFGLADAVYEDLKGRALRVDVYALEVPQVYRNMRGADPNDLVQIAGVGGAVGASFPIKRAVAYFPREWKGTAPKEIAAARFEAALTEEERGCIEETRKTYRHNAIDAVGLGLYELERMRVRMGR